MLKRKVTNVVMFSCMIFSMFSALNAFSQGKDTFKNCESFEMQIIPDAWQVAGGSSLELSTRHFKHGKRSLLWQWQAGAMLTATKPQGLQKATAAIGGGDTGRDENEPKYISKNSKQGGFKAWIYNETPVKDFVTFRFGSAADLQQNMPRYSFDFHLNFKGWRAVWVHFEQDARNPNYTGDSPVAVMDIIPPQSVKEGALFFDLIEFVDYMSWKRSADYQFPKKSVHADAGKWGKTYIYSQLNPPEKAKDAISDAEKEAFRTIEKRYTKWVLGDNIDLNNESIKIRYDALTKFIHKGIKAYERLNIQIKDGAITGLPLFSSRSPHKPKIGKTVLAPVFLPLALDYLINGNAQSKEKVMTLFDYVHDQGWADGSGMGTLNHQGNRVSGYMHAVMLLRDELRKVGKLEREMAAMAWFTDFGQIYVENEVGDEISADNLRTKFMYRLLVVLCMEDSPEKVVKMRYLNRWMNRALAIMPGFLDTIKPDYTGYHHRGVYSAAYAPMAFHLSSAVTYLVHGTEFAVPQEGMNNLKNALLTIRTHANKYDVPAGICGRFPENLSVLNRILPAYAYMALSSDPIDSELAAAFMRLWKPSSKRLREGLFRRAASNIEYYDTIGAIQIMQELAAKNIAAEKAPVGHWYKPYAGLTIHRRGNWMVSAKGWSQYIWDYESSGTENKFGRYLSYGAIQIYSGKGSIASGYNLKKGWDWNRWPGATTIHLPLKDLNHKGRISATYKEGRHRNFSDETFMGGVTLGQRNGIFAMKLHDTAYNPSFRARKSAFFFDDQVVCLGSGIENNDAEHATETMIFQTYLTAPENPQWVNDEEPTTQFPFEIKFADSETVWLMDPVGNGYVVPQAHNLQVSRAQQNSIHHKGKKKTVGDYATAWFAHGTQPAGTGYEYAILVKSTPQKVKAYAAAPEYKTLQKDNNAHIVRHEKKRTTGYVIFEEKETITHGAIRRASAPVLLMVKDAKNGMTLSLCDPDFRRPKVGNISDISGDVLVAPSVMQKVQVELQGVWKLDGSYASARMVQASGNGSASVIEFDCIDAKTIEVKLVKE